MMRERLTVFLDILHSLEVQMPLEGVIASVAIGQPRGQGTGVFGERMEEETVGQEDEALGRCQ